MDYPKIVGFIDLSKFDDPKRSVSIGASKFLKEKRSEQHIRTKVNKIWGGFINNTPRKELPDMDPGPQEHCPRCREMIVLGHCQCF